MGSVSRGLSDGNPANFSVKRGYHPHPEVRVRAPNFQEPWGPAAEKLHLRASIFPHCHTAATHRTSSFKLCPSAPFRDIGNDFKLQLLLYLKTVINRNYIQAAFLSSHLSALLSGAKTMRQVRTCPAYYSYSPPHFTSPHPARCQSPSFSGFPESRHWPPARNGKWLHTKARRDSLRVSQEDRHGPPTPISVIRSPLAPRVYDRLRKQECLGRRKAVGRITHRSAHLNARRRRGRRGCTPRGWPICAQDDSGREGRPATGDKATTIMS